MNRKTFHFWALAVFGVLFFALTPACGPRPEPLPPSVTYPSAIAARTAVQSKGLVDVPILGTGSMAPLIPRHPSGAYVVVAYAGLDQTPYAELKPGMVVVYSRYGEHIIHRLGDKDSRGFIAYGIANKNRDGGFVTPYNFEGRVAFIALYQF
jgi:hypothetical protein